MSNEKLDFLKFVHNQISYQKAHNQKGAQNMEQRFFQLLDTELDYADKLSSIQKSVERIGSRLNVIDASTEKIARNVYAALGDNLAELRETLVEHYCEWHLAINNPSQPDYKSACKHIIMQVEAVFKKLEPEVIQFIESTPENIEQFNKVKIPNDKGEVVPFLKNGVQVTRIQESRGVKYMRAKSMTWAIRGFANRHGIEPYVPSHLLKVLFVVRDMDSHPLSGDEFIRALKKVETNPNAYFDPCYRMINSLVLLIVALEKKKPTSSR